jgi:hypothetical protein
MRWPGVIAPGTTSDAMVMNVDYVPTFLELAGVPLPADLQGRSLRTLLTTGQPTADWRKSTYYHYFEYPAVHAVKRHYGLRTDRYKLIHFYYDIDAWELYDLQRDPQELRNVYDDPAYRALRDSLQAELRRAQQQYGDRPQDYLEPLWPDTVVHKARHATVQLGSAPAQLHQAQNPAWLTDGLYREFSLYNAGLYQGYAGYRESPLEVVLDLGKTQKVKRIRLHCRQMTNAQIYYPESVQVFVSGPGKQDWRPVPVVVPPNDVPADGTIWIDSKAVRGSIQAIKIIAQPRQAIPAGYPGAGQKAWLFIDEITVE